MQPPRFRVLEFLVLTAILGLSCSIPAQCYRAVRESDNQKAAEYHAESADRLEEIASHPAAWIAEFRPQLRKLASWEKWQSRRLNNLPAYDDASEERLSEEFFPAKERQRFWLRFNSIAALNGYHPPAPKRRHRQERFFAIRNPCGPTEIAIAILTLWLFGLRSRHGR
jgi:hypothetical protein